MTVTVAHTELARKILTFMGRATSPSLEPGSDSMTDRLAEKLAEWESSVPRPEPFGYFRAEPFGWVDCAETDEGAKPLWESRVSAEPVNARMTIAAAEQATTNRHEISSKLVGEQAEPENKIGVKMPCGAVVTNVYEAYEAAEQAKPAPELTDERIQQLWNENSDYVPNWNRHNAFARAIERELRGEGK